MRETELEVPSGRVSRSDELERLAARCEREEPGHELDSKIALAVGWVPHPRKHDGVFWWVEPGQSDNDLPYLHKAVHTRPPTWTSSLDAAVTLVPGGFYWSLDKDCAARVVGPEDVDGSVPEGISDVASTESAVLALCAAALRARAILAKQT